MECFTTFNYLFSQFILFQKKVCCFFFQLIRMRKTQKEKEITKLTRQKKFDMSESVMQA